MVPKTLDVLGPLHGYGVARRIEQISGDLLAVNQGTLYPVLLKLEQEGAIASEWGASENNRRARFYRLTRAGHKLLEAEARDWQKTAAIIARFFEAKAVSVAVTLACGIYPVRHVSQNEALHEGGSAVTGSSRNRFGRRILLGLQLGICFIVLVCCGLLTRTALNIDAMGR